MLDYSTWGSNNSRLVINITTISVALYMDTITIVSDTMRISL